MPPNFHECDLDCYFFGPKFSHTQVNRSMLKIRKSTTIALFMHWALAIRKSIIITSATLQILVKHCKSSSGC